MGRGTKNAEKHWPTEEIHPGLVIQLLCICFVHLNLLAEAS